MAARRRAEAAAGSSVITGEPSVTGPTRAGWEFAQGQSPQSPGIATVPVPQARVPAANPLIHGVSAVSGIQLLRNRDRDSHGADLEFPCLAVYWLNRASESRSRHFVPVELPDG